MSVKHFCKPLIISHMYCVCHCKVTYVISCSYYTFVFESKGDGDGVADEKAAMLPSKFQDYFNIKCETTGHFYKGS